MIRKEDFFTILFTCIFLFVVLTTFSSCGTTSVMECDSRVGIEKTMCLESKAAHSRHIDYYNFRGGGASRSLFSSMTNTR